DLKIAGLEGQRQAQKLERRQVEPLVTQVFKVSFADASDLKDNVAQMLTPAEGEKQRGSVLVDKHTNSLIVQAIRDDLSKVSKLVATLDTPRSQIQLKAHIVETTNDLARELGVQWGGVFKSPSWNSGRHLWVTPGGAFDDGTSDPVEGEYDPNLETGISGHGFGSNFPAALQDDFGLNLGLLYGMIGDDILELQLSALQQDGKLNILSSPSITTLDNQMAFTENGERVPFVSVDEDGDRNVEWEDAVLRLEITPHMIDSNLLKLHVVVKKDEVDFSRVVFGNPVIIKKQTETNLIVRHGETIVISGLSRQRNSDNVSGVPGLKDVPGLGHLFKNNSKSEIMEEVLVFITPHVLRKRSEVTTAKQ
ncbi:MAG: secretin N-terminal domain-containing protein, partial [Desulfohalobiaceae bacterium]